MTQLSAATLVMYTCVSQLKEGVQIVKSAWCTLRADPPTTSVVTVSLRGRPIASLTIIPWTTPTLAIDTLHPWEETTITSLQSYNLFTHKIFVLLVGMWSGWTHQPTILIIPTVAGECSTIGWPKLLVLLASICVEGKTNQPFSLSRL